MAVNRGLWVPINTGNVGTTELEARLATAGLFETNDGVNPRSGLLRPASPTVVAGTSATAPMSYTIAALPGVVINRVTNEGAYQFDATGTTTVTTTNAPVANSRIDVIWVKQNDQTKGDADNQAVAGVTQGAAAATPSAPAIPVGAMELARATITSTTTSTSTASIVQTFRYAALAGNPIPVRNTAELAEITAPYTNQRARRLDLPGAPVAQYVAGAWVVDEFSPVNTADANWTYKGGLWRDTTKGVTRVRMTLLMTRTGGSIPLTTSPTAAFTGLIPTGFRPPVSVDLVTVINTSTGPVKWGLRVVIDKNGDVTLRTDTGSSTIVTGDQVLLTYEWVI